MSCDPDVQHKIVLILQSDSTRLDAGALHNLIYGTFPDSVAREKSGNETKHRVRILQDMHTLFSTVNI